MDGHQRQLVLYHGLADIPTTVGLAPIIMALGPTTAGLVTRRRGVFALALAGLAFAVALVLGASAPAAFSLGALNSLRVALVCRPPSGVCVFVPPVDSLRGTS